MKLILALFALIAISSAIATPIFVDRSVAGPGPSDVKNWILAFLDGFDIQKYANSTQDCQAQSGVFFDFFAAGVENYAHKHYYDGSLNISDALGSLSPISRTCYDTEAELAHSFNVYWKQFKGIKDFISKVTLNAMSNVKPIKEVGTLILTEYLTGKNITKISYYCGEIVSLVFAFNDNYYLRAAPVTYTEADPLAADPINHILWTIFEGLYKFGINSKMVTVPTLQNCQEGILNMAVLDEQAIALYKKGDQKNALFAFTDSLTFSHQIVDGCYHTYKEFTASAKKVKEQVIDQGRLGSNIVHNLYFIVSNVFASWSQIFYGDYIYLLSALGSITYRVFVYGTN